MSTQQPMIDALVVDRPMCHVCLAHRTQNHPEAVETVLEVLRRALVIKRHPSNTCSECGRSTTTFLLDVR